MNPTWHLADPTHAALRVPAQIAQIGIARDDDARPMPATHIGGTARVLSDVLHHSA
jgi:hypothetical protein